MTANAATFRPVNRPARDYDNVWHVLVEGTRLSSYPRCRPEDACLAKAALVRDCPEFAGKVEVVFDDRGADEWRRVSAKD